jgi:hypothetical protein
LSFVDIVLNVQYHQNINHCAYHLCKKNLAIRRQALGFVDDLWVEWVLAWHEVILIRVLRVDCGAQEPAEANASKSANHLEDYDEKSPPAVGLEFIPLYVNTQGQCWV